MFVFITKHHVLFLLSVPGWDETLSLLVIIDVVQVYAGRKRPPSMVS